MGTVALRWLLDENSPQTVAWWLLARGDEVLGVREAGLAGRSDAQLNAYLHREDRILLTLDLDFSDPIKLPVGPARLVLRPLVTDAELICQMLARLLVLARPQPGELWVLLPGGYCRLGAE